MKTIFLLLLCLQLAATAKIAVFMIELANSQVVWNKRVTETLAKAGHDVTLISIQALNETKRTIEIDPRVKQRLVHAASGITVNQIEEAQIGMVYEDLSMLDSKLWAAGQLFMDTIGASCENTLKDKVFLKWLKEQNFDVAFAHQYDWCPIGLVHYAQIPSWVWLQSGTLMDYAAYPLGVPIIPSYVPPLAMASGSKMNFVARMKSFIGHALTGILYPKMLVNKETTMFRSAISPDFPDLVELAGKAPLAMVNSNELYELARPTLHKIINIGGLGMEFKDAKPLTPEYQKLVDESDGVVLMSFGSVANSTMMPIEWKKSLMETFSRFPQLRFVMRYGGKDMDDYKPKNVHFSKWLPQSDLLKHPKTLGFISHGGYNSIQETIVSGKPILAIPLFGDQPKNAKMAEQLGLGRTIEKKFVVKPNVIEENLKQLLNTNNGYSETARRISDMVRKKPIKPDELLLKWTEFLAEFKTLENLEPYGNQLNFVQYHSIDVILFISAIVLIVLYLVFWTLRKVLCFAKRLFVKSKPVNKLKKQ